MIGTGDLPGAQFGSSIFAVSGDGSTAVGTGHSTTSSPQSEAVRWTLATGLVSLGDLPGGVYGGRADGVNEDGSVIVGRSESPSGPEAFRWEDDGLCDLDASDPMIVDCMVGLGDLPGGIFASRATDVTPDGSIVVGKGESELGSEAFIWTAETGMSGLDELPGGVFQSEALAVSADGSVVVGRSEGPGGEEAFLWTEEDGIRSLKELLEQDFGLDLEGWELTRANGISDDGQVIVGLGRGPRRVNEAWIVELPEPSAAIGQLVAGGALVALAWRRRNARLSAPA
jgi:probable HAF family extracellular repeat protein